MGTFAVIGKALIGLFFAFMGFYNLKNRAHLIESLRGIKFQIPQWAITIALVLEIGAGGALFFDFLVPLGCIYLILFTLAASYLLHPFWSTKDREMWKHLLVFASNLAIIGGLFLVLSL